MHSHEDASTHARGGWWGHSRSNQSLPLSTPLHPILWPMSSIRTPGTTDMSCTCTHQPYHLEH